MRFLLALLAACIATLASPAWAQVEDTPAQAPANFAPSHLAAARDALQAIWVDSGALSQGTLWAYALLAPNFRQQLTSAPWYGALTTERRSAVNTYVESLGPIVQEETARAAPQVLDAFAPRLATVLNEAELNDITAFARSPEGSAYFLRLVVEGVRDELTGHEHAFPPSDSERTALARFEQTAGGVALGQHTSQLRPLFRELGAASTGAPSVLARLQRDLCTITGDQCPQAWRSP